MAKTLQILSLAMLAWFAYSCMTKLHWLFGASLCVFAVVNTATIWMLREKWVGMRSVVRVGLLRRYVNFVCYCSGDQVPSCRSSQGSGPRLLLRSSRYFDSAGERARQLVRGHDEAINRMLARTQENLTLRKRQRKGSWRGPLASFLLVGLDGVGKRYLARVFAKLLYRDGTTDTFECDQVTAPQLIGTKGNSGELESARRNPHRILLFECVDRATPELVRLFTRLLSGVKLRLSGSESDVSFEDTVVVFTMSIAEDDGTDPLNRRALDQQALERFGEATRTDSKLLNSVTELMHLAAPNDQVKSEVIALLLAQECRAHLTELTYVAPEIVATQVIQIEEAHGFAGAPQRIKKLLRKPLVAMAEGNHKSLSLRIR